MENKYYIPEIEEFHVGFECEYPNKSEEYEKIILTENEFTYSYDNGWDNVSYVSKYFDGKARVKYLDKEDIESLGFKQSKNDDYWYDREEDRFWLYKEDNLSDRWIISDRESEYSFAGTIKNKSELKRLLKQLNIN